MSSDPKEYDGKFGTRLTSGGTNDLVDVRKAAERATLSEP